MSEAKRRATRNKAYALGYVAGAAGRPLVNPYKANSGSRADVLYVQGYDDGKTGAPRKFEVDPTMLAKSDAMPEPEREAAAQPIGSDQ